MPLPQARISLAEADGVIEAALAHATTAGVAVAAVVVDGSGRVVAARCMDGSIPLAFDFALGKAYTAAGVRAPTDVWEVSIASSPALGLGLGSIDGFIPVGGGCPLVHEDTVVGAIGVSGGTVEQDVAIAQAAVDWLSAALA